MKKKIHLLVSFTLLIGVLFTSCGTGKRLAVSEAKVNKLQIDSANTHRQLTECNLHVNNLDAANVSLLNDNIAAQSDLNNLSTKSNITIADQAEQLKKFQNIVQSQKITMDKLKNSIANALMNYKADELYVYVKDGNVYVSLQEKLLFKSGSDAVDTKGKEALKTLAGVLNNTKDINVLIEGHTDNVPIKSTQYEDNWDLSTARATSILRILTNDYGFDSKRITSSGKGQYHPVKTNDTEIGRASNRRTEIILSPDLKELYSLLDN